MSDDATPDSIEPRAPAVPPPPAQPASQQPTGPVPCKRHPNVPTLLRCVRCGDPICPDCMRPAPVGYMCPSCAQGSRQEVRRPAQQVGVRPGRGLTLTNALLVILLVVYGIEVWLGGPSSLVSGPNTNVLVRMGASVGYACTRSGDLIGIGAGEQWRLFTAIFLHAGLIHLAMNGYALWAFGNVVEAELGKGRYLVIFFVGGLFASTASFVFGDMLQPGVGASGAIFAIFGAFAGYAWRRREMAFYAARIRTAVSLIILNAIIGVSLSSVIDWRAHAGGFIGGLVLGLAADGLRKESNRTATFAVATVGVLALTVLGVVTHTASLQALGPVCG
jgi:membrane associated rhomboid family serine protease